MAESKIVHKDNHLIFEDGRFYVTETPYEGGRQSDFPKKIDVTDDVIKAVMPKQKIDIDKFICGLVCKLSARKKAGRGPEGLRISDLYQLLTELLAEHDVIYKDGSLIKIGESKKCEGTLGKMLKEKRGIEIPFGAKDSELLESTITIPEGFTAEIKGNQISEQKSVNKVEPKFNVGDWVVWDNKISCHIDNIYQGKESLMYTITDVHNMTRSCSVKGFDNNAHLWTIQDAKDGEVLAAHECYVIFKEIDGLNIKCYCTYHYLGSNPSFYVDTLQNKTAFYPATKKQREFLFKKMHDAGYEWDAEKLELRKVEQKIEEKPLISLTDFQKAFELKAKQYDINLPNRGYDIHAMCKELYSLLTKQKPAEWSEEDEAMINNLYRVIDEQIVISGDTRRMFWSWLKSLKDRVQPKQEWSEDDNAMLISIENILIGRGHSFHDKEINWLKSLRPQNTWKPSDLPHWKKSTLPNDNTTGFNSDYFCHKGYNINYKELFEKLPKDD